MLQKRPFLLTKTKIEEKTEHLEKNYQNRISKQFYKKQNYIGVENGVEYMNNQREVVILTDF